MNIKLSKGNMKIVYFPEATYVTDLDNEKIYVYNESNDGADITKANFKGSKDKNNVDAHRYIYDGLVSEVFRRALKDLDSELAKENSMTAREGIFKKYSRYLDFDSIPNKRKDEWLYGVACIRKDGSHILDIARQNYAVLGTVLVDKYENNIRSLIARRFRNYFNIGFSTNIDSKTLTIKLGKYYKDGGELIPFTYTKTYSISETQMGPAFKEDLYSWVESCKQNYKKECGIEDWK